MAFYIKQIINDLPYTHKGPERFKTVQLNLKYIQSIYSIYWYNKNPKDMMLVGSENSYSLLIMNH